MATLLINLTLVELIVLPFVAFIFCFALHFFIRSRKTLRETLEANGLHYPPPSKKTKSPLRNYLPAIEGWLRKSRRAAAKLPSEISLLKKHTAQQTDERAVGNLKQTIAQQQQLLNKYIGAETEGKEALRKQNNELQREIIKLHELIEKRDAEIEDLYQQASAAKKMAERIDEAYQEFDLLQSKMKQLEKQAGRANTLAIELEDTRNAYEVIHKELTRKQEKLELVMEDNRNMKEDMNLLEDKLSEANLQRQQLQKKVQFLTSLNNDMQDISDTNKKLQTEMRRIGELESMLSMMAEERDHLLRRKTEK